MQTTLIQPRSITGCGRSVPLAKVTAEALTGDTKRTPSIHGNVGQAVWVFPSAARAQQTFDRMFGLIRRCHHLVDGGNLVLNFAKFSLVADTIPTTARSIGFVQTPDEHPQGHEAAVIAVRGSVLIEATGTVFNTRTRKVEVRKSTSLAERVAVKMVSRLP